MSDFDWQSCCRSNERRLSSSCGTHEKDCPAWLEFVSLTVFRGQSNVVGSLITAYDLGGSFLRSRSGLGNGGWVKLRSISLSSETESLMEAAPSTGVAICCCVLVLSKSKSIGLSLSLGEGSEVSGMTTVLLPSSCENDKLCRDIQANVVLLSTNQLILKQPVSNSSEIAGKSSEKQKISKCAVNKVDCEYCDTVVNGTYEDCRMANYQRPSHVPHSAYPHKAV